MIKLFLRFLVILLALSANTRAQQKYSFPEVQYIYQNGADKDKLQNTIADGLQSSAFYDLRKSNQGVWAADLNTVSEVSRFSFMVNSVFHQTIWFQSAVVIFLLAIGFFVHKLYASIRQEMILKKLVLERTKELQTSKEKLEITNQQLYTTREQYHSLFFQNPYAVFSFDLAGNFVSANKVTADLTGYSIEELLKMSFVPLIHKDYINDVLEKFIKAGLGEAQNYQTEIQTANGNSLYVDVTNLPLSIDGKILGIYGIVKDITEEKLLADQLASANERFRLANKATSDSIWDWDLNTNKIERDGSSLEAKLGHKTSSPENIFESFRKLTHPEDAKKILNNLTAVLANKSESFWEDECRLLKPDNTYAIIYNRGYIIRNSENHAIRMIGASRDITERRLEEQQQKLMESVITHTTDAVTIFEVTEEGLKMVFVNDAYIRMTGYTQADVSGKMAPILQINETYPDDHKHFEQALKSGKPCQLEKTIQRKNREVLWVDVNMVPVKTGAGSCTHWVSIERDITQRKKQTLDIEQQNKQLKEIAWIQSHTVRAPLSRMMGIISLIEDGSIEGADIKEFLNHIKTSGAELDRIIRDIVRKTELVEDKQSV